MPSEGFQGEMAAICQAMHQEHEWFGRWREKEGSSVLLKRKYRGRKPTHHPKV